MNSESRGVLGWLTDALGQQWSAVSDPVHAVTGEFYVDAMDLELAGPLPLDIRRNYSSLNLADNQFGIGWKFGFTPYLSLATNETVVYAAEPDGSVLAYEKASPGSTNWIPTLARNPQLVNSRQEGIGSTANLFYRGWSGRRRGRGRTLFCRARMGTRVFTSRKCFRFRRYWIGHGRT